MRNEEHFETQINEAVAKKVEMIDLHGAVVKDLCKIFKGAFGKPPKDLKLLMQMEFYKGGYPNDKSPAKIAKMVGDFATLVKYYHYMGQSDKLNDYLKAAGLEVNLTSLNYHSQLDTPIRKPAKIQKLYNSIFFPDDEFELENMSKVELLKKLLDVMVQKEGIICELKDAIKYDLAPDVEEECDVQKSHFNKVVDLKVKDIQKGNFKEEVQKMAHNYELLEQAIQALEG